MAESVQPSRSTTSPVRRIQIIKLFGDRDVDICFDSPVTIVVADNGSGKTTILNMIYAVLSGALYKLRKFTFECIHVETSSGTTISIPAEIANFALLSSKSEMRARRLFRAVPEEEIFHLINETHALSPSALFKHPLVVEMAERTGAGVAYLIDLIRSGAIDHEDPSFRVYETTRKSLSSAFPYPSLYFPTYRRIEEELEDLGYTRKEGVKVEGLIRFGMADVIQRIKEITGRIEKSSVEWYSRISGQMLSQLIDGFTIDENAQRSIRDQNALKIVLDRVGTSISQSNKSRIMQLVDSGEIENSTYQPLAYFLSSLIKVYDQHKEYDTSIKDFTRVCNKYLIDKEVVYNESKVDLQVQYKSNGRPVELAKLSSGEKQIVSLFSRLYLEGSEKLAVLFDEPELSLSIDWQKMLLPDVVQSGRCSFLLATTHSPFIFENDLDGNAYDLANFVREVSA